MEDGRRTYFRITGRVVGFPTLLLVAAWLGLWLAWPRVRAPRYGRVSAAGRTAYGSVAEGLVMNPTLFATVSRVGFHAPEEPPSRLGRPRVSMPSAHRLSLYDGQADGGDAVMLPSLPDLRSQALDALDGFRIPATEPMRVAASAPAGILVETSGDLSAAGFKPDLSDIDPAALPGPWQVRAVTEIDETGKTVRVFVEQSSGSAEVDGAVERALRRGRASAGRPLGGRVTVSLGRGT